MNAPTTCEIRHITIDCADPFTLAGYWSQVTGWRRQDGDEPGDPEVLLTGPDPAAPGLLFIRVPEPKTVKNRIHLDLSPRDRTRDDEVEHHRTLGGTVVSDQRRTDGSGWVVLADPEGNEYCVERSAAERRS